MSVGVLVHVVRVVRCNEAHSGVGIDRSRIPLDEGNSKRHEYGAMINDQYHRGIYTDGGTDGHCVIFQTNRSDEIDILAVL